jgi:hypothetical protein
MNSKAICWMVHKKSGKKFEYSQPIIYFGKEMQPGCYIVQFGNVFFLTFGGVFEIVNVSADFEIFHEDKLGLNIKNIHMEKIEVPENVTLYKKVISEKDYRDKLKPLPFTDFFKEMMEGEELMILWNDKEGCLHSTPINRAR